MRWIKLWTEEVVKGTTFSELNACQRGIWFSLLALAGIDGTGFIQAGADRKYTDEALSNILNVNSEDLIETKKILVKFNKIIVKESGIIEITNWCKYQDEYSRQKPYRITKKAIEKKKLQARLQKRLQRKLPAEVEVEVEVDKEKDKVKGLYASTQSKLDNPIKDKIKKIKYLEFVYLTEIEHTSLIGKYNIDIIKLYIDKLNNYIGSTGKRYKSHYHTLLNWILRDDVKIKPKERKTKMICGSVVYSDDERLGG